MDLLNWTMTRRRWLDAKNLFDLKLHQYLIGIYLCTAVEIAVKKAAQLGLSEWLISYALHGCDERGMDVMYTMPTDGDVSDFSQSRFGPAIEASDYLQSIVVQANQSDGKRGSDKVTLKRIRDSFLYLRGGQVRTDERGVAKARQLKSVPADALILDELDEMDPRAPEIGRKRLGHSKVGEVRSLSTPTYPGRGIDQVWRQSDQREYHLQCPACGEWQPVTKDNLVLEWDDLERPVAWYGGPDEAWLGCRKCGKKLDRMRPGRWVVAYPGRDIAGFHPTKLIAPFADLMTIIEGLTTVDETKRRETTNQDLGETYTPRGGQLNEEVLNECRRDYAHGPRPGQVSFAGVDVGKVLNVVIRGECEPDTGGWPQLLATEVDTFEELGKLVKKFKVKVMVIDALPETRKTREFQVKFPGVVWVAYYNEGSSKAEAIQWDESNGTANLDRTRTLDDMLAQFYDGKNTLPANAQDIPNYYSQMIAPVRVIETRSNGTTVARYVEGSNADHYAHAENYCRAAMSAPRPPQSTAISRSVSVDDL